MDLEALRSKLRLDASGFTAGLQAASESLNGFQSRMSKVGKSLKDFGSSMTAKVSAPIVAGGLAAIKWASDLNEASSAVNTVFGDAAKQVSGYSGSVAKSLGLSRGEALSAATTFGAMGQQLGLTGKALASFSNDSVQAGVDLASFYNTPVPDALAAIQSGLQGEAEPLRRYGIFLSDAALNQYAMARGIGKTTQEMTEQEKIALRQQYILEHLGAAEGDFARTSDGLANKMRITKAQFKDAAATLGTQLLPLALKAVTFFSRLIERFNKLSPSTKKWVLILAGVAAAIGPILLVLGHLATAIAALTPVFTAIAGVISLPLLLIVGALVLLAVAWTKNWGDIRGKTKAAVKAILGFLNPFVHKFLKATETVRYGVRLITDAFKKGGLSAAIGALFGEGGKAILTGLGRIIALPGRMIGQFLRNVETGFAPLDNLLDSVGQVFTDISLIIQNIFAGEWGKAFDYAKELVRDFKDQIINEFKLFGALIVAAFKAIPWGALWDGLKAAIVALIGLFQGIDWGGVASFLWNAFTKAIANIPWADIALYIADLSGTLTGKGKELFQSLRNGVDEKWQSFVDWLGGRPGAILGAFPDVAETLKQKGRDLIHGLRDAALAVFGEGKGETFTGWVKSIPGKVVFYIGKLGETLKQKGKDLLGGLSDGAHEKFAEITNWVKRFKATDGPIAVWVGNLAGTLVQAGKDLMGGLAAGISGAWDVVSGALTDIWNKIPSWFKKLSGAGSPAKKAMPLGNWVSWGIAEGLIQGLPRIRSALDQVADTALSPIGFGSLPYAGPSQYPRGTDAPRTSGGTTVYGGIHISVDGASDPNSTADAVFAKFSREIKLATGVG